MEMGNQRQAVHLFHVQVGDDDIGMRARVLRQATLKPALSSHLRSRFSMS